MGLKNTTIIVIKLENNGKLKNKTIIVIKLENTGKLKNRTEMRIEMGVLIMRAEEISAVDARNGTCEREWGRAGSLVSITAGG